MTVGSEEKRSDRLLFLSSRLDAQHAGNKKNPKKNQIYIRIYHPHAPFSVDGNVVYTAKHLPTKEDCLIRSGR